MKKNEVTLRIGEKIRKIRKDAGLTQAQIASMAGLSQRMIVEYEQGATPPSHKYLTFLTSKLHADPQWLLGERPDELMGLPLAQSSIRPTTSGMMEDIQMVKRLAEHILEDSERVTERIKELIDILDGGQQEALHPQSKVEGGKT